MPMHGLARQGKFRTTRLDEGGFSGDVTVNVGAFKRGTAGPGSTIVINSGTLRFDVHGSYADPTAPTEGLVEHGWDHSLGEIVTALIEAGLRLEFLHEFDFVRWPMDFLVESEDGRWRLPDGSKGGLPLFFSLKATKPVQDGV